VSTMLIIDEFNALRMREETSILFEQVRSFGGNLIIAAQGYAGLGPCEYADRILDATNTYILHSCSDPFQVSKRAGKRLRIDTSWTEQDDEMGGVRRHIRPHWDWKVPEHAVMQQEEGEAFWINRGHAQQVRTVQVPITRETIAEGWEETRRQAENQRALLTLQTMKKQQEQGQASPAPGQSVPGSAPTSSSIQATLEPRGTTITRTEKTPRLQTKISSGSTTRESQGPLSSQGTQSPQLPLRNMGSRNDQEGDGPDHL